MNKNIKIPNKIIIWGKDGYNPLGLLRQLHEYADLYFLMLGGSRFCAVKSKYCKNLHQTKTYEEGLDWLLMTFSNELYKPFIITTGDLVAEYVDQHYNLLSEKFHLTGIRQQGSVTKIDSKAYMNKIASKYDYKIPRSMMCGKESDISAVTYPCILKPFKKHPGHKDPFKTKICEDENSLKMVINSIDDDYFFLLQEYVLKKADALVYGCRTNSGKVILAGTLVKLRWDGVDCGDGSFGYLSPNIPSSINTESIKSFLDEVDYYGLFSVEYGLTDDAAYFYEFNLRNDGTSNYFNQAGCNIPLIWILDTIGVDYSQIPLRVEGEHVYIAEDDDYNNVRMGVITKEQYKKDLASATVFRRYDPNDMMPYYYNKIIVKILQIRRLLLQLLKK